MSSIIVADVDMISNELEKSTELENHGVQLISNLKKARVGTNLKHSG